MAHVLHNPGQVFPRITRFDRNRDRFRRYVTDSPSAESFATWLRAADGGDLAALQELQEEMESKDAFLQGVANTRRGSVNALDWDIEPDDVSLDQTMAKLGAAYCRKQLVNMVSFNGTLKHLSVAIGPNLSVSELVWFRGELVETLDVPGHRLTDCQWASCDKESEGIITDDYPTGLAFDEYPDKFVVYNHQSRPLPYRRTMTHATAWPYIVRHYARSDWMAFSEIYGTPIKSITSDASVVDKDRTDGHTMLENMGADSNISLPNGMSLELLSPSGTGATYKELMEWAQKEIAVLWLGQTLTTDIGDKGSFAAAKVHDNVRADLLISDLEAEAETIREQILRPMIKFKFPGKDVPVPIFKRLLHERTDIEAANLKLTQLQQALQMGLPVNTDEAYEALNLTRPKGVDSETVGGMSKPAEVTNEN